MSEISGFIEVEKVVTSEPKPEFQVSELIGEVKYELRRLIEQIIALRERVG